jgi:Protein of unknown function (DUF4232)
MLAFIRRPATVACAVSVATLAAAAVVEASSAAPAGVPACSTSGLVVWLNTNGNGAAGSIFYKLEFTNQSGHKCTLAGYPGVSAVDLARHQLGSPAARNRTRRPRTITLANGKTATAILRIVEAGNFPPSACHQRPAAGLRVFPPNRVASKIVPFPFSACARRGPVYLTVAAVR